MALRLLILGGTAEARALGERLAGRRDVAATLSLAGRTSAPLPQALPVRSGGFGGAAGLAAYLAHQAIDLLVDATHPFAARISAHAAAAAAAAHVPILALRRPAWERMAGDRWREVEDVAAGVAALGTAPRGVFVALGRQELGAVAASGVAHRFVVRSIEPVAPEGALRDATFLLDRGPFDQAAEEELFARHGIEAVLAKNSGGAASYGKIAAARALGLEVVLIRRPAKPDVATVATVEAALAAIGHHVASRARRGV